MNSSIELLNFTGAAVEINADAEAKKTKALALSSEITEVADDFDNQCAVSAVREIKSIADDVEKCRKKVKAPVLELVKSIDQAAKDFTLSLADEQRRVNALITSYATEQRRIAFEAERKRQEEQQKLEAEREAAAAKLKSAATAEEVKEARATVEQVVKAEADIKAVLTAPKKTEGLVVRTVKGFKIIDIEALHKARPDLVHVMPKRSEILEAIKSAESIPGLEIFEQTKTSVRK